MISSAAEIDAIVKLALPRSSKPNAERLRRMLHAFENSDPGASRAEPLERICAIGVAYGWRELERSISPALLERTSAKARASLREYLQSTLHWITHPSFDLEWTSFTLALEALHLSSPGSPPATDKFLGATPVHRLFSFFKKFPALAELWSLSISQWREHVAEVLGRAANDDRAISRAFFQGGTAGPIVDVRLGLSDRHNGGRSVALVEFERGRVIYKPRSGTGERAWASLLGSMNENGFRPRLKSARVLRRKNYHWMEYIDASDCDETAGARRYYQRVGGLIAAAYLLKAVDCHRENLIAAGEHPVLVDLDAPWHVSSVTKTQSAADLLYRTGFFPNSNPESLQSRSSALGKTAAAQYAQQIVVGFAAGWRCLVGTPQRRAAFLARLRRIRSQERRWIYQATARYAAVMRASVQPGALTSAATRVALIRRLSMRPSVDVHILDAEIKAVEQLDIPYFISRTNERMPAVTGSPLSELLTAIRKALGWIR